MQSKLNELKSLLVEADDLGKAAAVLSWDQTTTRLPVCAGPRPADCHLGAAGAREEQHHSLAWPAGDGPLYAR